MTKICKTCGVDKPIKDFPATRKGYIRQNCRVCVYARNRELRALNRPPLSQRTTKYCPKCGRDKPKSDFPTSPFRGRRRLRGYCKDCHYKKFDAAAIASQPVDPNLPADAYFAGHFDGEGTLVMLEYKTKNARPHFRVSVTSTHLPTLLLYKARFGGGVGPKKTYYDLARRPKYDHYKIQHIWQLGQTVRCLTFLEAIHPFAIEKKPQIEVAISWLRYRLTLTKGDRSGEARSFAIEVMNELKRLKRVEYPGSSPVPKE